MPLLSNYFKFAKSGNTSVGL